METEPEDQKPQEYAPEQRAEDQAWIKAERLRLAVDPLPNLGSVLPPIYSRIGSGKCYHCQTPLSDERFNLCEACDAAVKLDIQRRELRDKAERTDARLARSCLPRSYRKLERKLEDFSGGVASEAVSLCELVDKGDAPGAYLFGPEQTFKTSVACSFLAARIAEDHVGKFTSLYVSATDFMTDIYNAYSRRNTEDGDTRASLVAALVDADHLVLDDFAKEKASEHSANVWFEVFDGRFRRHAPNRWMLVTSNWSIDAACDRFDAPPETVGPIRHRLAFLTVAAPMIAVQR